jgi:hypothetical protein
MTDRELLEYAARAAGYVWNAKIAEERAANGLISLWLMPPDGSLGSTAWNPLNDDGDALRLVVKLELTEVWFDKSTGRPEVVCGKHGTGICVEPLRDDPCAATRRAIVRAAAEIGKAHPATPKGGTECGGAV